MREKNRCKRRVHAERRAGRGSKATLQRARATLRLFSFRVKKVVKSSHVAVVQHLHDLKFTILHEIAGNAEVRGTASALQRPSIPLLTLS